MALVGVALAADDHSDHDHGAEASDTGAFEWAGIFPTPEAFYLWTAQSNDEGEYADPTMNIVLLPASDDEEETLHGLEAEAEDAFTHTPCTEVDSGQTFVPALHKCYQLHFDTQVWQTLFRINTNGVSHTAIFAQHFPTEFERDAHYLKDSLGEDIEPTHTLPEEEAKAEGNKPWGTAIGASFLVMICTLIGVVFIAPFFVRIAKTNADVLHALSNAFAAGALLAAAFYLMLYEATHLIVRDEESFATAEWGSMILTGFITATVLDIAVNAIIGLKPGAKPIRAPPTLKADRKSVV